MSWTWHEQVRIAAPEWTGCKRIRVDRGVAPLLRWLWRRGFVTWASCEEISPDTAYVVFVGGGWEQPACFALLCNSRERFGDSDAAMSAARRIFDNPPAGWELEDVDGIWPDSRNGVARFPRELLTTGRWSA